MMEKIILLAREIGKELQNSPEYAALMEAEKKSNEDMTLQNAIGEFNLKRLDINNEAQKEDRNEETLMTLNNQLREIYGQIMMNENMQAYNNAKAELDAIVQKVATIVTRAAEGDDPETCDCESCGGNCGSCGGCH